MVIVDPSRRRANDVAWEERSSVEVTEVARKYAHRAALDEIPCTSVWTSEQQPGVPSREAERA